MKMLRHALMVLLAGAAAILPSAALAAEPIVIKFSHVVAPDTPKGKAAEEVQALWQFVAGDLAKAGRKRAGAEVWAHARAKEYLDGGEAERRLQQRSRDLFPWVDEGMKIVRADRWLERDEAFTLGGVRFEVSYFGPAHSPDDMVVVVPREGVIFIGDILFAGRIPFVGEADSKLWLERIEHLLRLKPRLMVTGHGAVSRDPARDLTLTRDYLLFLREAMGRAVEDLVSFEEAYAKTDWSRFARVPAFDAANRINAYGQYLLMERELLKK